MYIQQFKPHTFLNRHYKNFSYFNFSYFNFWYFKKFLKNKSGRNNKGSIVIFTKKNRQNLWFTKNNFSLWNSQSALIINFKYFMLKGIFFLLKFCNGSISLVKGIYGLFVGNYINIFFCFLKKIKINFLGLQCLVIFVRKYLFISNIRLESRHFNIYSSSNGCYSQIIDFFFDLNLVKIRFSSGTQKIISGSSICVVGRNNNIYHKYLVYGGYKWSGYLGKKSLVRGVAMNPVDHPHGGRTKTNKPEVSPWNWITKFSH